MKKTTKQIVTLSLLTITFLPSLTNAEKVNLNTNIELSTKGEERGRPEKNEGFNRMGTSTKNWNYSTSTRPIGGRSIGGLITVINTNSFSIEFPSKNGTSTTVVNTDANTVFRSGTSTIALSNLTVGQRVSVLGEYSTSTNTLAAKQVMVIRKMEPINMKKSNQGFFGKIVGWFKKVF